MVLRTYNSNILTLRYHFYLLIDLREIARTSLEPDLDHHVDQKRHAKSRPGYVVDNDTCLDPELRAMLISSDSRAVRRAT